MTGAAPTVDVQSVTQQRVISAELIAAVPTGRSAVDIAILIPGIKSEVSANGNGNPMDVGGVGALSNTYMTLHGSSYLDQRVSVDGIQIRNIIGPGNANNFAPNMSTTQEMNVETEAGSVEQFTGGVRVNFVPREGGNVFKGSFFATGANSALQANNITPALRSEGLASPNALVHQYDINPSVGGPILVSKLWFYAGARWQGNENYLAGMYVNANAGNPLAWSYVPDYSQQARFSTTDRDVDGRITWQAAPSQKVNLYYLTAHRFWQDARPNFSPESFTPDAISQEGSRDRELVVGGDEAAAGRGPALDFADTQTNAIEPHLTKIVEQSGTLSRSDLPRRRQLTHRSTEHLGGAGHTDIRHGSPCRQLGVSESGGTTTGSSIESSPLVTDHLDYRFNNGIPNQLTEIASPYAAVSGIHELGIYAQDRWTIKRLHAERRASLRSPGDVLSGADRRSGRPGADADVTFPETSYLQHERSVAARRRGVRPVRHGQDGGESQLREVSRRRCGNRRQPREQPVGIDDPHVDGLESELHARLRSH